MRRIRIGVCTHADVFLQNNRKAIFATIDVLLFPELLDGGYAALHNGKPPHTFNDDFVSTFRSTSKRFSATVIAGSTFLRHNTHRPTNTSLVFARGRVVHSYDKIHLFTPAGDAMFFERGALKARHFQMHVGTQKIRAGVIICYDLRFPELVRTMAARGISLLFVPARWPQSRDEAWQSLLKARAIENQIFVVGCNADDDEGGFSYAFGPTGNMIFSNRKNKSQHLHSFEIDLNEIPAAKQLHGNLHDAVFLRSLLSKR